MGGVYLNSLDANWESDSFKSMQKKKCFNSGKCWCEKPLATGTDCEMGVSAWVELFALRFWFKVVCLVLGWFCSFWWFLSRYCGCHCVVDLLETTQWSTYLGALVWLQQSISPGNIFFVTSYRKLIVQVLALQNQPWNEFTKFWLSFCVLSFKFNFLGYICSEFCLVSNSCQDLASNLRHP